MAEPTLTKTWTKYSAWIQDGDGPPPQSGQTSDRSAARLIMYIIKTQMLAAGWTVVSSCGYYDSGGGESWHYGASDHWPDAASVRWKEADNKFGWIVLKNTILHNEGNGFQVCFSLDRDRAQTYYMTMALSWEGGFSGGDEFNRPIATDEVVVYNNEAWYSTAAAGFSQCPLALNIWYTNDGECFRAWGAGQIITDQGAEMYKSMHPFMFERLCDPPDWLGAPVVAGIMRWRRQSMMDTSSALSSSNARRMFFYQEGIVQFAMMSCEGIYGIGPLTDHAACQMADLGGHWPVFPITAFSESPMVPGRLGELFDFWAVPTIMASGDYMPGDGSKQMVIIQGILQGNDGTFVITP